MNLLENIPIVFTTSEATFFLKKHYKAPLKALSSLERSGRILRLRRGLYACLEGFEHMMAAYRVHGPSYVSYETALEYYGLIPERVHQIISVVDGRPAHYLAGSTKFIYHTQERLLFTKGMTLIFINKQPIPIATPEKALLDTLANHKLRTAQITPGEVLRFVTENLRIDLEALKKLSMKKMKEIAPLYRNLAPRKLVRALSECRRRGNE